MEPLMSFLIVYFLGIPVAFVVSYFDWSDFEYKTGFEIQGKHYQFMENEQLLRYAKDDCWYSWGFVIILLLGV